MGYLNKALDIKNNRIIGNYSNIMGIWGRFGCICIFRAWLGKIDFCAVRLYCIHFGCRFDV